MNQWFSNYQPENYFTLNYWPTSSSGGSAIVVNMYVNMSGRGDLDGGLEYLVITVIPRTRSQVM